jgi:hypothetical protein
LTTRRSVDGPSRRLLDRGSRRSCPNRRRRPRRSRRGRGIVFVVLFRDGRALPPTHRRRRGCERKRRARRKGRARIRRGRLVLAVRERAGSRKLAEVVQVGIAAFKVTRIVHGCVTSWLAPVLTEAHVSPTSFQFSGGLCTYRLRLVEPAVTAFENVELWVEDSWIQSPVERPVP